MRRKLLPVLALGMAGAMALSGCGGSSDNNGTPQASGTSPSTGSAPATTSGAPTRGNADLVIWADDKRAAALKDIAAKFGEDNGITVAVQAVSTDLQTNFITANNAGNGPDIVVGAHDWIGNMVRNNAITPLQLSADQKAAYNPLAIKGVTYQGQTFGLPYALENLVLFRNTDMVAGAPGTFEDLVSTGKAAVSAGKAKDPLALQVGQTGDPYHLEPLFVSAGGYLFGQQSNGDYDPNDLGLSKPSAATALAKIAQYGEKGQGVLKRSIDGTNAIPNFTGKKAPYLISGPWAIPDIKKAGIKYDISPIPGFKGGKEAAPFVGVQAFYVASKAKNASFAQEFLLNAINTPEAMTTLFNAEPRIPALTSVYDTVSKSDADIPKLSAAGKNGLILPSIPAMAAVWDPFGKAEAAIIGGADPTKTIAGAASTIKTAIAKN